MASLLPDSRLRLTASELAIAENCREERKLSEPMSAFDPKLTLEAKVRFQTPAATCEWASSKRQPLPAVLNMIPLTRGAGRQGDAQGGTSTSSARCPLMFKPFPLELPQSYDALPELAPDARLRAHYAKERLNRLTPRQWQVLDGVVDGLLNKQIAHTLGIDEKTVKMHRTHMKTVLGVRTSAAAIKIAVEASFNGY